MKLPTKKFKICQKIFHQIIIVNNSRKLKVSKRGRNKLSTQGRKITTNHFSLSELMDFLNKSNNSTAGPKEIHHDILQYVASVTLFPVSGKKSQCDSNSKDWQ